MDTPRKRVLAISSCGGHWVQMLRLRPALADAEVTYASTDGGNREDVPGCSFIQIPDGNRWNKFKLLWMAARVGYIVLKMRPDVILSTGAAPGYFAMRVGKLIGATTIWVDSVANAERMSMCGRRVRPFSDLWLTQWPFVAEQEGANYLGAVL